MALHAGGRRGGRNSSNPDYHLVRSESEARGVLARCIKKVNCLKSDRCVQKELNQIPISPGDALQTTHV